MRIMMTGLAFFLAGFSLHWLIWRIRVPLHANISLLGIFLFVLCVCFLVVNTFIPLTTFSPQNIWEYFHISLFYTSMSLSYIVAYSALEGDSPSTTMVKFVDLSGGNGRSREEFSQIITNDSSIELRISAMIQGGLAIRVGENVRLTTQGIFWQKIFSLWMRLLGIQKGG